MYGPQKIAKNGQKLTKIAKKLQKKHVFPEKFPASSYLNIDFQKLISGDFDSSRRAVYVHFRDRTPPSRKKGKEEKNMGRLRFRILFMFLEGIWEKYLSLFGGTISSVFIVF